LESQTDLERRMLLAILLAMAVLFATPYIFNRFYPAPETPPEVARQAAPLEVEPEPEVFPVTPPVRRAEPDREAGPATEAEARTIILENEDLLLRWNSAGAVLESARLKGYLTREGEPVELIPPELPPEVQRPFGIRLDEEVFGESLREAVFEVQGAEAYRVRGPAELVFEYRRGDLEVRKSVQLPATGFILEVQTEVLSGGRPVPYSVVMGPGVGEVEPETYGDFGYPAVVYYAGDSVERVALKKVEPEGVPITPGARWVAMDSQYFAYLLLDRAGIAQGRISRVDVEVRREGAVTVHPLLVAEVTPGRRGTYSLFVGPKDYETLAQADPTLSELIDFGWFAILVKPLLFSLKYIYQYIGNYGWSIIILTFIINLALFPIRYKQMVSMKKMSELQPKLRSIQDKYKRMKRDDPRRQEMNVEVMGMYRQHGVNPLGGCLPLVIQMPFLFAFYRMLVSSIELRGAHFFGWIRDLSQYDPYYITPIAMGLSMVAQQKMTPATGDPTQRRMMMILPVVFTFFFLHVSSGLAIYFLFSNLFGMMFQFMIQRWNPDKHKAGASGKAAVKK
jgi:YidC/Oxa1 family membrane protein insertase